MPIQLNSQKMSKSLENTINYMRNILRKEGITGMDSIKHCIAFIICRMLDKDMCEKFDVDEKYSYENMMKDNKTGKEMGNQDLANLMYSGDEYSFIGQLVTKLKFENIRGAFKLHGAENMKDIMKKLKEFDPKHIESKYDIIGTIYEIHLKSGTSNAMRDLGQYYTHRLVIDYMIKLCDPEMNKGKIDKIVDPTMGTGGFLTMAIKYLNEKYKNKVDWKKNKDNIIGFDIDDNVRNMALLNVLLETGELFEDTICKQDTLHNDMKFENGEIVEKAKIILANEPMGLKNITLASCCKRIQNGLKAGTKAEPLFLKLFMEALDDNGKCAVIVPDGVLFGDSNLHTYVKKMLIEKFNLKKIISLNDDFFLNTGVKTSILFFVKDGGKTNEIEFSELKLNNDKVEENTIINVKYDDIKKNDYSLFVNKYNKKEQEKINGVEYKKIIDLCDFLKKSKRPASFGTDIGKYNFYVSGEKIKRCDDVDYNEECIIIGTGGNANIKYDSSFSCSTDTFILKSKNDMLIIKYLYYYFLTNMDILENGFSGSTIKHISKDYVSNLEIQLPDINIQKKIVDLCDLFNNNIKTCKKQLEETKEILNKYIEIQTKNIKQEKTCNDLFDMTIGKKISKDVSDDGIYDFYNGSAKSPIGKATEYSCDNKTPYILIIKDGGAGQGNYGEQIGLGKSFYVSGKTSLTTSVVALINKDEQKYDTKYLYYYLHSQKNNLMDLAQYTTGLGHMGTTKLKNYMIKLPTIDEQKKIVTYCDKLNDIINFMEIQIDNNKNLMVKVMNEFLKDS